MTELINTTNQSQQTHAEGVRAQLVETINKDTVVQALTQETGDLLADIRKGMGMVLQDWNMPADEKNKIISAWQMFNLIYADETGKPNRLALQNLSNILVSKIEVATLDELLATAEQVVIDSPDEEKEIVMFIDNMRFQQADMTAPRSVHSDDFMIKLVKKCAEQKGKTVKVVTKKDDLTRYERVCIVDDAVYSGVYMGEIVGNLVDARNMPKNLGLYFARATDEGIAHIRKRIGNTSNPSQVHEYVGGEIHSLYEALQDSPETFNYFFVRASIGDQIVRLSPPNSIATIEKNLRKIGLTLWETKTPDYLSFPEVLSQGMDPYGGRRYPDITTLRFV